MRANCDFTEYKHDKNQGIYGKNQRYPLLERMENQETDLSTLKTEYMEATVMSATAPVQKQQGLNQVVINKVRRMIEGRQRDVMDTINRLLSEGRIAQDFIAPIGVSQRSKERPVISFKAEGRVQMAMVIIFAGARFSTSDYGNGSVDMRSFLLNGACLNGMVRESVMRQVHLGGRLPDSLSLSQKTYELDTQTTVSAVSDLTKGLYSKDTIMQKAIEIQGASEIDVDFDKELKNLVQKGALLKNEGREVEKLLMNNNPDDGVTGGATLWKLTQGITAFAREQQPERCRELHEISGQLMNRVKVN